MKYDQLNLFIITTMRIYSKTTQSTGRQYLILSQCIFNSLRDIESGLGYRDPIMSLMYTGLAYFDVHYQWTLMESHCLSTIPLSFYSCESLVLLLQSPSCLYCQIWGFYSGHCVFQSLSVDIEQDRGLILLYIIRTSTDMTLLRPQHLARLAFSCEIQFIQAGRVHYSQAYKKWTDPQYIPYGEHYINVTLKPSISTSYIML